MVQKRDQRAQTPAVSVFSPEARAPRRCLWGAASSAGQCEGAYLENGKGLSIIDTMDQSRERCTKRHPRPLPGTYYSSHEAVDFYHHLDEDLDLMAECGLECFRTSFAWSRLFPTGFEEEPDPQGLAFYDRLVDGLIARGIEPIITLSHLETPYELFDLLGGWEDKRFIGHFVRYAEAMFAHFKGRVRYWIPFNEINTTIHFPFVVGVGADRAENPLQAQYQATHNMAVANALAVAAGHAADSGNLVGGMTAYAPIYPLTPNPADVWRAKSVERENLFISDLIVFGNYPAYMRSFFAAHDIEIEATAEELELLRAHTVDFLAMSYYNTNCESAAGAGEKSGGNLFGGVKNPYLSATDWGWQIDPMGMRIMLCDLAERYRIPLMVVENGIGARDAFEDGAVHDDYRIAYLDAHMAEVQEAIERGADVIAYTMWSFTDIISASGGAMSKRYGLVYVDRDDEGHGSFARARKDSFFWFRDKLRALRDA